MCFILLSLIYSLVSWLLISCRRFIYICTGKIVLLFKLSQETLCLLLTYYFINCARWRKWSSRSCLIHKILLSCCLSYWEESDSVFLLPHCSLPALEVHPTFTVRKAVSFHTFLACLLGLGIGSDSDKNLSTWLRQSLRTQPNPRTQPHWHRWPDSQTRSHKRSRQPQTHINSRTSQHRASGKKVYVMNIHLY